MEPLSLVRPKALLPFGDNTVLGRLAGQLAELHPQKIAINASRCPELLAEALRRVFPDREPTLCFEERPLGASATLARNAHLMSNGTWMIVNTDMVMDEFDASGLLEAHRSAGADWTVLVGRMPNSGDYAPLSLDENGGFGTGGSIPLHYWGISVIEPKVSSVSARIQCCGGLFSELTREILEQGGKTSSFMGSGDWLDMGDIGMLRSNILRGESYIHPGACLAAGVRLEGRNYIGRGCILAGGTSVTDSVMLQGSSLESGELIESLVPWFCTRR